jgi:hypothetical protein
LGDPGLPYRKLAPLRRGFCFQWPAGRVVGPSFLLPVLMHGPRALPQRDPRRRPARHGCSVGRLRHLEVVYPCDLFGNAGRRQGACCVAEATILKIAEEYNESV